MDFIPDYWMENVWVLKVFLNFLSHSSLLQNRKIEWMIVWYHVDGKINHQIFHSWSFDKNRWTLCGGCRDKYHKFPFNEDIFFMKKIKDCSCFICYAIFIFRVGKFSVEQNAKALTERNLMFKLYVYFFILIYDLRLFNILLLHFLINVFKFHCRMWKMSSQHKKIKSKQVLQKRLR